MMLTVINYKDIQVPCIIAGIRLSGETQFEQWTFAPKYFADLIWDDNTNDFINRDAIAFDEQIYAFIDIDNITAAYESGNLGAIERAILDLGGIEAVDFNVE